MAAAEEVQRGGGGDAAFVFIGEEGREAKEERGRC
jgi:hypothetical protein